MRGKRLTLAFLATAGLALGACSKGSEPDANATGSTAAVKPESEPLPDMLDDAAGLQVMAEALKETGVAGVFKGKGSYTLLAAEDAAFGQLGETGKELTEAPDHAALAALLRDHLIPGYITPQDIAAAIDASKDQQVSMTALSGRKLTFAKSEDGTVTVAAPDGSQANIAGEAIAGGSSVAIPVDAVLKKI